MFANTSAAQVPSALGGTVASVLGLQSVPGAGDTYGPTVTNTGELATSGEAMHPWANFSR